MRTRHLRFPMLVSWYLATARTGSSSAVLCLLWRSQQLHLLLQMHLLLKLHHPAIVPTGRSSETLLELHKVSIRVGLRKEWSPA